ncbi:hypothetical protein FQN54_001755 [Arachnomyces sp. PD_36]|nr:hypothetical protein FQN54_001755 [Arachnomyces sp. PD_36]
MNMDSSTDEININFLVNGTPSNPSTPKKPSHQRSPICDSCGSRISISGYRCQECHDFDYCNECFTDASLIHPGHTFASYSLQVSEKPRDGGRTGTPQKTDSSKSRANDGCSSCHTVTTVLPTLHLAMKEAEDNSSQGRKEELNKHPPDRTIPDNSETRPKIAEDLRGLKPQGDFDLEGELFSPLRKMLEGGGKIYQAVVAGGVGQSSRNIDVTKALRQSFGSHFPCSFVEYGANDQKLPQKKTVSQKQSFRWAVRISKLVEATQRGCAFCSFFLSKVFVSPYTEVFNYYGTGSPWYSKPNEHPKERGAAVLRAMEILTKLRMDSFEFQVTPTSTRKGTRLPDFSRLTFGLVNAADDKDLLQKEVFHLSGAVSFGVDVYVASDDPAAGIISSRPPNPSPASDQAFELINKWVSDCESSHGRDCGSRASYLPTRLVEICTGESLRLYEPVPNEQGRYVALSYCWGGPQKFQTLKSTVADRLHGFSVSVLPKTLQDALRVTQRLGIRFLWVDALCIIQDDPSDKAHEISKIAQVYQNAFLTLSATRALTVQDGFLADNKDESTGLWKDLIPVRCRVPSEKAMTLKEGFQLPPRGMGTLWLCDESDDMRMGFTEPVSRRAWCLQEQILSPRLLAYGRWPKWRCRTCAHTDGGYYWQQTWNHDDTDGLEGRLINLLLRSTEPGNVPNRLGFFSLIQLYQGWYRLVQDFTGREISCPSDKLPAIGGVAAEMSRVTGSRYLAGLWEHNILHDLMWFTRVREWLNRPAKWRAPTWSWASIDSLVVYNKITADAIPLATVTRCNVTLETTISPFGEVRGGTLIIEGPFAPLESDDVNNLLKRQTIGPALPKGGDRIKHGGMLSIHSMEGAKSKVFNDKTGDFDELPSISGALYGLITFKRDWRIDGEGKVEDISYSGLLLREAEGKNGHYERVGSFLNVSMDFLEQEVDSWELKSITII